MGLASEWRFEKGDRKSYNGSSESKYKSISLPSQKSKPIDLTENWPKEIIRNKQDLTEKNQEKSIKNS